MNAGNRENRKMCSAAASEKRTALENHFYIFIHGLLPSWPPAHRSRCGYLCRLYIPRHIVANPDHRPFTSAREPRASLADNIRPDHAPRLSRS